MIITPVGGGDRLSPVRRTTARHFDIGREDFFDSIFHAASPQRESRRRHRVV
jgi:hypothetical protein